MKSVPRLFVDEYLRFDRLYAVLGARPKEKGAAEQERKKQLRTAQDHRDTAAWRLWELLETDENGHVAWIRPGEEGGLVVPAPGPRQGDIEGGGTVCVEQLLHESGRLEHRIVLG
jgi:hypothetical protein